MILLLLGKEKDTKAHFGDIRKKPVEILGCSVSLGRISPLKKSKQMLLSRLDNFFKLSLDEMAQSQGERVLEFNYLKTMQKINNILMGWGGAFSFCDDKGFFVDVDAKVQKKVTTYYRNFQKISKQANDPYKHQRLLGLQSLIDCTCRE